MVALLSMVRYQDNLPFTLSNLLTHLTTAQTFTDEDKSLLLPCYVAELNVLSVTLPSLVLLHGRQEIVSVK